MKWRKFIWFKLKDFEGISIFFNFNEKNDYFQTKTKQINLYYQ